MSTPVVATFTIGAILGASWSNTFSKAAAQSETFSDKAFSSFAKAKKGTAAALTNLSEYQKAIGNATPTAAQASILETLSLAARKSEESLKRATESVSTFMTVSQATAKVNLANAIEKQARSFANLKNQATSVFSLLTVGILGKVTSSATELDELAQAAEDLSILPEQLQRIQYAASPAAIKAAEMTKFLEKMNRLSAQAAEGTGEAANAFAKLGLSAKALNEKNAAQKFEIIMKAIGGVKNTAEQARLTAQIFGEEASTKIPGLARRGWEQISKDMEDATAHIMQNDAAGQISRRYLDAMNRMKMTFNTLAQKISIQVMPVIEWLMDGISTLTGKFSFLVPVITGLTTAFVGIKVGMLLSSAASLTFAAAQTTIRGVMLAATAAQWAWNAAMSANPIGLIITGVAALAAALAGLTYLIYDNFGAIKNFFVGVWQSILDTGKAALNAVSETVTSVFESIYNLFPSFFDGIKLSAVDAFNFYASIFNKIFTFTAGIVGKLKSAFLSVKGAIVGAFSGAWNWVKNTFWGAIQNHPMFKLIKWAKGKFFSGGEPTQEEEKRAEHAVANDLPISSADLEMMTPAGTPAAHAGGAQTTTTRTVNNAPTFNITQQPGEDSEALARRISERLAESYENTAAAAL